MKIDLKSIIKIKEEEPFYGIFYCTYKSLEKTKYGDSFINLAFKDSTGLIDGKLWNHSNYFNQKFNEGDIVSVKGVAKLYREKLFLDVDYINSCSSLRYEVYGFNKDSLNPDIGVSVDFIWKQLSRYLKKTKDYQSLIKSIYKNYKKQIIESPYNMASDFEYQGVYLINIYKALKIADTLLENKTINCDNSIIYSLIFLQKINTIPCCLREDVRDPSKKENKVNRYKVFEQYVKKNCSASDVSHYKMIFNQIRLKKNNSIESDLVNKIFEIVVYARS